MPPGRRSSTERAETQPRLKLGLQQLPESVWAFHLKGNHLQNAALLYVKGSLMFFKLPALTCIDNIQPYPEAK